MIAIKIEANFGRQNRLHLGRKFNKQATKLAERAALYESQKKALELYRKTVTTWDTPTQFSARRTQAGWTIIASDLRYRYLDLGTKVRYATMTKGFRPKTRVGVLYSYAGAGRVAYVNRGKRRKGIKARGWTEKIQAQVDKIVHRVYREKLHANWINPD